MAGLMFTILCLSLIGTATAGDFTQNVFGYKTDFIPAAFGDFNSDEYTDLFVIKNDKTTVEILLGSDSEPLLKQDKNHKLECKFKNQVTSVVPGDFDGDALLDLLVTVLVNNQINSVHILWGNLTSLDCSNVNEGLFRLYGQPLAIDYNFDMVEDLFGEDEHRNRTFWIFFKDRSKPEAVNMLENTVSHQHLKYPHSNAFIDLNRDSMADLYLTVDNGKYEVWHYNRENKGFELSHFIPGPSANASGKYPVIVGQTLFMDVELDGKLDHVVPICFQPSCLDSAIYVYSRDKWFNLRVNFNDPKSAGQWGFVPPEKSSELFYFTNTITLHGGDFNMDGYPDLLATLKNGNVVKSYLLENIACEGEKCDGFPRTFNVLWTYLAPYNQGTTIGVFFDFSQNGVLDILFVHDKKTNKPNSMFVSAYKNNLDYDANFIKIMVLTGITNNNHSTVPTPLKRFRKIYGTSFPGPIIWYKTTTQDGNKRAGVAAQLPQSAYFSLQLPYTLFGLGRTPNFVDTLDVGLDGENKTWTQIIPNSQLVVIPNPLTNPKKWMAQLFVTPSKVIVQTILALLGTCALISIIIIVLWWKERREDHFEKLQEAHKFHFDAM